jgi:hypothetical protein
MNATITAGSIVNRAIDFLEVKNVSIFIWLLLQKEIPRVNRFTDVLNAAKRLTKSSTKITSEGKSFATPVKGFFLTRTVVT